MKYYVIEIEPKPILCLRRAERLNKRSFVVSPRTKKFIEGGLVEEQIRQEEIVESLDDGSCGVMDG